MGTLQIFIPSYRRSLSMTTPALLLKCGVNNFKVVVREDEYSLYRARLPQRNLMVIESDHGLNDAREDIRGRVGINEWSLHMDDNVLGFVGPNRRFYKDFNEVPLKPYESMVTRKRWQHIMNEDMDFKRFYDQIVSDTLRVADKLDVNLCGFSAHENPAFRAKKFSTVGYVCGKVMLLRNVGLPWRQSDESSGEDYALTAAHLFDDRRVLINRWGHPLRKHYQPGGCGPYEEWLPAMKRAQKDLMERYGALFGVKKSKTKEGELRIRFYFEAQVEEWRKGLANLHDPNYRE